MDGLEGIERVLVDIRCSAIGASLQADARTGFRG